ncbi:MAG: DUF4271 domain-containing protein [Bacteroidales bacterium]|jgi:hypothetical protein|nr:DUF4271 domain-containing protein [Bacteroidales bacterium]
MNDSIIDLSSYSKYLLYPRVANPDTSVMQMDSSAMVTDTFFHQSSLDMMPLFNQATTYTWFLYVLLFLSFGVALIWYLIPERLTHAFAISVKPDTARLNERESPAPGAVVTFFFLVNSLINISFLIFYVLKYLFDYDFGKLGYGYAMLYIAAIISAAYLLKMILAGLAGWMFDTVQMARKQAGMYFNSNIALGVVLLPLLFVLVIIPHIYLLYAILFIVAILFLIRWVQVIRLGISITHFNFFHLILYLCTLEIIPVLVVFKIFM